jgi:hypothetical protein
MLRPRPSFPFPDQDRPSAKLPDGPVPCGRCEMCQQFFDDDIYILRGVILCGDCRYFVRNGRWPNYDRVANGESFSGYLAVCEWSFHRR